MSVRLCYKKFKNKNGYYAKKRENYRYCASRTTRDSDRDRERIEEEKKERDCDCMLYAALCLDRLIEPESCIIVVCVMI